VWYAFACVALAAGNRDEALRYLNESVQRGYTDVDGLISDYALQPLRGTPEFQKIVGQLRAPSVKTAPN
jgi:hypothetical protein